MAVSIRDIAREAGVTVGTVSRALNNYPDVSPTTRERIVETAQRLGYRPNQMARNLPPSTITISRWCFPAFWKKSLSTILMHC